MRAGRSRLDSQQYPGSKKRNQEPGCVHGPCTAPCSGQARTDIDVAEQMPHAGQKVMYQSPDKQDGTGPGQWSAQQLLRSEEGLRPLQREVKDVNAEWEA